MGNNPSKCKGETNLPVDSISWNDCQQFIKRLREQDKKRYRLPSEAEWEYACRAGTTTAYHFGDDKGMFGEFAWYVENSGNKTHPVGQKKPNAWGLHDLHGNVSQWCQDWIGADRCLFAKRRS
jgi:formylglycine-generating enzyme required for sulfatase activity